MHGQILDRKYINILLELNEKEKMGDFLFDFENGEAIVIGMGGSSYVLKGVQKGLNRPVAIKIIISNNHEDNERYKKEAIKQVEVHQMINSGVVVVHSRYDYNVEFDGCEYFLHENGKYMCNIIIMEMLTPIGTYDETTHRYDFSMLFKKVQNNIGKEIHKEYEVKKILKNIASVLSVYHRKGLHHDIKPDNIFYSDSASETSYKLGDFGIAHNKIENVLGGTGLFLAPEVKNGMDYTVKSEVFSLGLTVALLLNNGAFPEYEGDVIVMPDYMGKNETDTVKLVKEMCCVDPFMRPDIKTILNKIGGENVKTDWNEEIDAYLELADEYFFEGKYDKSVAYYKKASDYGSTYAKYQIGTCYFYNDNDEEAQRWYYKAAKEDYHPAILELLEKVWLGMFKDREDDILFRKEMIEFGISACENLLRKKTRYPYELYGDGEKPGYPYSLYGDEEQQKQKLFIIMGDLYGEDWKMDYQKSKYYYELAYNGKEDIWSGHAALQMGFGYLRGKYGEIDINRAIDWFIKAANKGEEDAAFELGRICLEGYYVPKNEEKALFWFEKCGSHHKSLWPMKSDPDLKTRIARLYYDLAFGEKGLFYQLIDKERQMKTISYLQVAADLEYTDAIRKLGDIYGGIIGRDFVKTDYKKSLEYYTRAAEMGDYSCAKLLGYIFSPLRDEYYYFQIAFKDYIKNVRFDKDEAIYWLEKALEIESDNYTMYVLMEILFVSANSPFERKKLFIRLQNIVNTIDVTYKTSDEFIYDEDNPYDDYEYDFIDMWYTNAESEEEYEFLCEYLKESAKKGDGHAQYYLSRCYRFGLGVKTDNKEAVELFIKAVKNSSYTCAREILDYDLENEIIKEDAENGDMFSIVLLKRCIEEGWTR